jgi:uncharacterized membrane protein YcjF (UPF0283 family)
MPTEDKMDQFKADVADLKLKTGGQRRDSALQVVGLVLMVLGVVAAVLLYEASLHQTDARNIASEEILAMSAVGVTVIGAALFVVAALSRFLRLWLLRQMYEGQNHLDQVLDSVRPQHP